MKTAVGRVGDVTRPLDLVRVDELVPGADLLGDGDGGFFFEGRQAGGHGRDSDSPCSKDLVAERQDERAVDPARVTYEDAAHLSYNCAQLLDLWVEHGGSQGGLSRFWKRRRCCFLAPIVVGLSKLLLCSVKRR